MNNFGKKFSFTSFGESHGEGIGVVLDGFPAGVKIDYELINCYLLRRQGGGKLATPRKEADEIKILSGIYDGFSTGAPICVFVENKNTKSKDYEQLLRPAHADFSYLAKYKNFDYRGGGRSSARESLARVIAGAFAAMVLKDFNIRTYASLNRVGGVFWDEKTSENDFVNAAKKELNFLGDEKKAKEEILDAIKQNDSVGASVKVAAFGVMAGLGEVLYDKFDARVAAAFMGLNAVKAVEFGGGIKLSKMRGSRANDEFLGVKKGSEMNENSLFLQTKNNYAGGVMGGITTGETIEINVHFKPTPSIFQEQTMMDYELNLCKNSLKGRHDPCVGVRACVILESMLNCVILDFLLLNATATLEKLKNAYK